MQFNTYGEEKRNRFIPKHGFTVYSSEAEIRYIGRITRTASHRLQIMVPKSRIMHEKICDARIRQTTASLSNQTLKKLSLNKHKPVYITAS